MRVSPNKYKASAFITILVFVTIIAIAAIGILRMTSLRNTRAHERQNWNEAFIHAENALTSAAQMIADDQTPAGGIPSFMGRHILSPPGGVLPNNTQQLSLPYSVNQSGSAHNQTWVYVQDHPNGQDRFYEVVSSARVGDKVRTIRATIEKNPPSQVFDYEYFLNNWGWWWGSSITGYGDNRTNWDFDFRYNPTVNGGIYAAGNIEANMVPVDVFGNQIPFGGEAASDPLTYVHIGSPRLNMPNLKELAFYETKALDSSSTIKQNGSTVVQSVHGDDESKSGLYLDGRTHPIEIDGPIVVRGDLIINGTITGVGTFYVGGNIYIAGDLEYGNSPDFSTPPDSLSDNDRDDWVEAAGSNGKDLVAFAARGAIFGGDVNSTEWIRRVNNPSSYGMRNVGNEAILGEDGIRDTPDDSIDYLDTDGDGIADSSWFDADEDGIIDGNYDYDSQIKMTNSRATQIQNYPIDNAGNPVPYTGNVATNNWNRLDGIFYTNHAFGIRPQKNDFRLNGAVICRDEAIIFNRTAKFVYDPRVHSRYSNDPNKHIDLDLPIANKIKLTEIEELSPIEGFYN